jgi:NADPH:quinone reductase-like Zn-dependent oxidoreductase
MMGRCAVSAQTIDEVARMRPGTVSDDVATRTETMRAIVRDRYGSPDVLRLGEVARPEPGRGQVLVRVRAASIFAGDVYVLQGRPWMVRLATGIRRPKHAIPGIDVAGVVEEVGAGVTSLRAGDEVFGWSTDTLAEFVVDDAERFVTRPSTLTLEEAATIPEAGMTALQGLRDNGKVQAGQSVLIIGASGGVGSFAMRIAKAFGAEVTATASTRNVELVRSAGADHVIDYERGALLASPARFDLIFQAAGTASPLALRRLLTPKGTLVLSSGQGRVNGVDRILVALVTSPFVSQRLATFVTKENRADLVTLGELAEAGKLRPLIDRTYPLADAAEAFRYLAAGHTRGKVVITV